MEQYLKQNIEMEPEDVQLGYRLVFVWIVIAAILLLKMSIQYMTAMRSVKRLPVRTDQELDAMMQRIQKEQNKKIP